MGYKIAFKDSVWKDLKQIDKHQAQRILQQIEETLPERAEAFPTLTGRFAKLRKFRVGNYRVIYTLQEDSVLVLRIQHRKEVYR